MLTNQPTDDLVFDDDTMDKVYDVMREDGGLTEKQTRNLIKVLRVKGFVFREKRPVAQPTQVYRGVQDEAVSVQLPVQPPAPEFPTQTRGFANYLGQNNPTTKSV